MARPHVRGQLEVYFSKVERIWVAKRKGVLRICLAEESEMKDI